MATFHPTGGSQYTLGASIGSTDTTILLSSFTEPISGTPYTMVLMDTDIVYATIAPISANSEFISFTGIVQNADGTATLTGVTRGLSRSYPYTSSSTFKLPHAGQSIFILSDSPSLFGEFAIKSNAETVGGDWNFTGNVTFTNFPVTPSNSNASSTVKGVSKLSVDPVLNTNPIALGDNDGRVPVAYAVDSVGTDAYAITPSPAISAYVAGQVFKFKAGTANTGAATLNVNGLGAKTIKKNVSTDLATGDILVSQVITVIYDGTNMQLQSAPSGTVTSNSGGYISLAVEQPMSGRIYTYSGSIAGNATTGTTTITHSLGVKPTYARAWIVWSNTGANESIRSDGTAIIDGSGNCTYNSTVEYSASGGYVNTITDSILCFSGSSPAGASQKFTLSSPTTTQITLTNTKAGSGAPPGAGVGYFVVEIYV